MSAAFSAVSTCTGLPSPVVKVVVVIFAFHNKRRRARARKGSFGLDRICIVGRQLFVVTLRTPYPEMTEHSHSIKWCF
jgi:hypothetical protein